MEQKQNPQADNQPIVKPQETAEYLMSPVGQQIKKFEITQRIARAYASSTIVPTTYRGDANIGNCIVALEMAERIGATPLLVMQNLYIVHGNPGWSAKFLIATFNQCGKYTPIRYEEKGTKDSDDWGMRAYAYELSDKEKKNPLYGAWIDINMAKAEGWYDKNPKWKNIPEQMLRYRSAAWFVNTVAPEISMGLSTVEEQEDMQPTRDIVDADYEDVTNARTVSFDETETNEPQPSADAQQEEEKPQAEKQVKEKNAHSLFS